MKDALLNLKQNICTFSQNTIRDETLWKEFANNTIVALMAGGLGSRLKTVTDSQNVHKTSLILPDGETMIEKTIKLYRDAGITNFLALVYHKAESIINVLGDGKKLGVTINYSYDPEPPAGKGGAVKNALLTGAIPSTSNLIIHNPDDMIVNYKGNYVKDIIEGHLKAVEQGALATVVVVEETPYQYTGMSVQKGLVKDIEMYPPIPVPTHVGVTLFSPEVYGYFDRLFDFGQKMDFEKVLFPELAKEQKLGAVPIPNNCWIAVNNPKALDELVKRLEITTNN